MVLAAVVAGSIVFLGFSVAARVVHPGPTVVVVLALALVPFVISGVIAAALDRVSRRRVVDWLGTLPFEVENMNSILAGVSDTIEVIFAPSAAIPSRADLQPKLEPVSDDLLVLGESPEERLVTIRLGVIDSKRLPLRTNYERWIRLCAVVDRVLLPLNAASPIERIRVA